MLFVSWLFTVSVSGGAVGALASEPSGSSRPAPAPPRADVDARGPGWVVPPIALSDGGYATVRRVRDAWFVERHDARLAVVWSQQVAHQPLRAPVTVLPPYQAPDRMSREPLPRSTGVVPALQIGPMLVSPEGMASSLDEVGDELRLYAADGRAARAWRFDLASGAPKGERVLGEGPEGSTTGLVHRPGAGVAVVTVPHDRGSLEARFWDRGLEERGRATLAADVGIATLPELLLGPDGDLVVVRRERERGLSVHVLTPGGPARAVALAADPVHLVEVRASLDAVGNLHFAARTGRYSPGWDLVLAAYTGRTDALWVGSVDLATGAQTTSWHPVEALSPDLPLASAHKLQLAGVGGEGRSTLVALRTVREGARTLLGGLEAGSTSFGRTLLLAADERGLVAHAEVIRGAAHFGVRDLHPETSMPGVAADGGMFLLHWRSAAVPLPFVPARATLGRFGADGWTGQAVRVGDLPRVETLHLLRDGTLVVLDRGRRGAWAALRSGAALPSGAGGGPGA